MSVIANENNDVTLFREVNCKMRLFAMKYSIEFEEKINQYNSLLYRKKSKVTNTYVHGLCDADDQLKNLDVLMFYFPYTPATKKY